MRPLLGFTTTFPVGATAGLRLSNSGLGPARITRSLLTLNGKPLGAFSKTTSMSSGTVWMSGRIRLPWGDSLFSILTISGSCSASIRMIPSQHHEFRELIEGRLRLEIQYESIYGGEGFTVVYPRQS